MAEEDFSGNGFDTRVVDALRVVVAKAEQGDASMLPRLRELLDESPGLWRHYGDTAGHVEETWIRLLAANNLAVSESLARRAAHLRKELAGDAPSPLERLLVDRAVVSWLQINYLESRLAQHQRTSEEPDTNVWQKRLDAAHRRHLEAVRVLAEVRKLMPRSVKKPRKP